MMKTNFLLILLLNLPFLLSAQQLKLVSKKFPNQNIIQKEYTVLKKKKYIKHGAYKIFFENEQIKEIGNYHHNQKDGEWKEYDEQGQLRRVKKYVKGKLITDNKFGIWKEVSEDGKLFYYDYDKQERIMPPIPIPIRYPAKARESGIGGIVKIRVRTDDQCELKEIKVVKSLGADFDQEAIKGIESFIGKLKFYEEDCKNFDEIIRIEFKTE